MLLLTGIPLLFISAGEHDGAPGADGGRVELTEDLANELCKNVVEQLVEWPVLPAVLQVGGIESRGSSRILIAIEEWLRAQRNDLIVIPEYRLSKSRPPDETTDSKVLQAADRLLHGRRIDYAIVTAESVGQSSLMVDTVIEVKTNYLCQSELRTRPAAACDQANAYGQKCGTHHAYVLYIVASPVGPAPEPPRDAGWAYYRTQTNLPEIGYAGPIAVPEVRVLGQYPAGNNGREVVCVNAVTELWACVLVRR